jgi:phage antirepressor YoqD-like protein
VSALIVPPSSMSSREIAELTGSTHDNVLKTVRSLVERGVVSANETPYVHPQNGQTYGEFLLTYRDTMVVVSGYSVELRARIIDRWQELEAAASNPLLALNDPATMRNLLLGYTEKVLALESTVAAQAPKVAALDRIATGSDGSFCLTDAAKNLQVQPRRFFAKLPELGWIHRRPMGSGWLAYQTRISQGLLEHKMTTGEKSNGSEWQSTQVRVTAKGMVKLSEVFVSEGAVA